MGCRWFLEEADKCQCLFGLLFYSGVKVSWIIKLKCFNDNHLTCNNLSKINQKFMRIAQIRKQ